jgi:hypothetical protein
VGWAPPVEDGGGVLVLANCGDASLELAPDVLRTSPAGSNPAGSRPFAAASCSTLVPNRAAIADSVSPGWTT